MEIGFVVCAGEELALNTKCCGLIIGIDRLPTLLRETLRCTL
jgi:hypothetical protein